jgi:hypothetical protein
MTANAAEDGKGAVIDGPFFHARRWNSFARIGPAPCGD